jgi:hypothetical protein
MRFLGLAALIGLSLYILDASAASCPQKESPIRTDRPDVTNSSVVVPQSSFQARTALILASGTATMSSMAPTAGCAGASRPAWRFWSTSRPILLP